MTALNLMSHDAAREPSPRFLNIYIYIYVFSWRFYPKRLTVHSGYIHFCQNVHKHYDYESVLVPSGRGGNFRDGFAVPGDDGLTHIYFGGLRKCSDRMDVVVEDDYPHHDT